MVDQELSSPQDNAHEQRLLEVATDQGNINYFMADSALRGSWTGQAEPPGAANPSALLAAGHRPRRGGRPYPEKSGRDAARELANREALDYDQLDEDQKRDKADADAHGAQLVRRAIAPYIYDELVRQAGGNQAMLMALVRKHDERPR